MNKKMVSFELEVSVIEKLRQMAEEEERSLASLIRRACRAYLNLPLGQPDEEVECK